MSFRINRYGVTKRPCCLPVLSETFVLEHNELVSKHRFGQGAICSSLADNFQKDTEGNREPMQHYAQFTSSVQPHHAVSGVMRRISDACQMKSRY